VGRLGVEAIEVEEGRREVSHGEQNAAAGGDRRQLVGEPRVVELHRVDVVLTEGLLWCGRARSGLPTVSKKRWRTVIVSDRALARIGGQQGARKHKQGSGKLARGSVKAMGARWWLSTVTRGSPERRSGWRRQLELGVFTAKGKEMETASL
jgi:hypothetical protein